MTTSRPTNLDLFSMHFPVMAIVSITHRVCAVISWVGFGTLICVLAFAVDSELQFNQFLTLAQNSFSGQFLVWAFASVFTYYCLATLKHILQDMGFCEELGGGRIISWATLILGAAASLWLGVYTWI